MTNTETIVQDTTGWFFRVNPDGSLHCLSSAIATASARGQLITLVRDGQPTTEGDSLATRTAVVLARRYA